MNTVVLSGRLTRDPELRSTQSGLSVASFTLAVDRAGDKVGEEIESGFFDITVWGNQAENVATYLNKGSRAAITGELRHHKWETDAGDKRSKVEVNARWVEFLETKAEREEREGGQTSMGGGGARSPEPDADPDDDVPF